MTPFEKIFLKKPISIFLCLVPGFIRCIWSNVKTFYNFYSCTIWQPFHDSIYYYYNTKIVFFWKLFFWGVFESQNPSLKSSVFKFEMVDSNGVRYFEIGPRSSIFWIEKSRKCWIFSRDNRQTALVLWLKNLRRQIEQLFFKFAKPSQNQRL